MKKEQTEPFDFEAKAISKLMQGERLGGEDGILTPLIKRFLEKATESELDHHLLDSREGGNRKNG
jgi:putative transposase